MTRGLFRGGADGHDCGRRGELRIEFRRIGEIRHGAGAIVVVGRVFGIELDRPVVVLDRMRVVGFRIDSSLLTIMNHNALVKANPDENKASCDLRFDG